MCGRGGNVENRKMFSHREHGFPTGGAETEDMDWVRAKAIIWRMSLRQLENEEAIHLSLPF